MSRERSAATGSQPGEAFSQVVMKQERSPIVTSQLSDIKGFSREVDSVPLPYRRIRAINMAFMAGQMKNGERNKEVAFWVAMGLWIQGRYSLLALLWPGPIFDN